MLNDFWIISGINKGESTDKNQYFYIQLVVASSRVK